MRKKTLTKNVLFVVCGMSLLISGCYETTETVDPDVRISNSIGVTLEIDFDGQRENITFHQQMDAGSSVVDLMEACQNSNTSETFEFKHRGSGESAFVYSISGVENEMAAGANWLVYINEKMADQGAGLIELSDGDVVKWKFSAEYLE
jgi:hypothetical protein